MTPLRGKLAQHLFVKIDMALKEAEARRNPATNKVPYSWAKINMQKAALSAVHRIELGLDGLIPNHIWPIAYYNNRAGVYDLDLRIGYAGKDYYYRKMALCPIVDIIYELVHENDRFTVIKKSINEGVESYTFEIPKPFDRGQVVGGFGYIMYQNPSMNKLVIVDNAAFEKAKSAAKSKEFWNNHSEEMKYKTIVHRTVKSIVLDPEKINESFGQVEADEIKAQDRDAKGQAQAEVDENANTDFIDITPDGPEPNMTEEEKAEIRAQEAEIPDPLDKEQRKPAF
jgi:recombination protein RecT